MKVSKISRTLALVLAPILLPALATGVLVPLTGLSACNSTQGNAVTPAPTATNTNVLEIGLEVSTTGTDQDVGQQVQQGVAVAMAELNSLGGVLGKQLVPSPVDLKSDPSTALDAVTALVNKGVVVGIGPTTGEEAVAIAPLILSGQVLLISPSASSQDLDTLGAPDGGMPEAGAPVLFRTVPSDTYLASAITQFATAGNPPRCSAIAIVAAKDDYGTALAASVAASYIDDEYAVVGTVLLDTTAVEFSDEAGQVGKLAGDGTVAGENGMYDAQCQIVLISQPTIAAQYMVAFQQYVTNNARQRDPTRGWGNFKTIGSDSFHQPSFISNAYQNVGMHTGLSAGEGSYAVAADTAPSLNSLDETTRYTTFLDLYEAFYPGQTPGNYTSTAYDAMILLAAAIQQAGTATDVGAIHDALFALTNTSNTPLGSQDMLAIFQQIAQGNSFDYVGASGPCSFSPTGGVTAPFGVWQIKNSDYVQVQTFQPGEL